ncbi:hypothetical protein [Polynucleobacter sp. AM-25C3]|jgi:hypothetical protein|uniref:hypothetical protein n=1 Tax=Polynucleobacter sp. AM-25C3 TaxID=1855569 RepID=UPI001C0E6CA0|nr:hypothetical protein [Polynucleobacter sp. AM-25C3]MBU3602286.1 hypothetical protein [Polynucleobacter sp. AM-25C3]
MQKPTASPKAKKNSTDTNLIHYEAVLSVVREARSWLELRQIALLSGVSMAKCRALLAQMVTKKQITSTLKTSVRHPDGIEMYAKLCMAKCQAEQRQRENGFEIAKSRFELWPELMDGRTHRVYAAKPNQLHSLAMLSRRA